MASHIAAVEDKVYAQGCADSQAAGSSLLTENSRNTAATAPAAELPDHQQAAAIANRDQELAKADIASSQRPTLTAAEPETTHDMLNSRIEYSGTAKDVQQALLSGLEVARCNEDAVSTYDQILPGNDDCQSTMDRRKSQDSNTSTLNPETAQFTPKTVVPRQCESLSLAGAVGSAVPDVTVGPHVSSAGIKTPGPGDKRLGKQPEETETNSVRTSAPSLSPVQQLLAAAKGIPNFPVIPNMTPEQETALAQFLQQLATAQTTKDKVESVATEPVVQADATIKNESTAPQPAKPEAPVKNQEENNAVKADAIRSTPINLPKWTVPQLAAAGQTKLEQNTTGGKQTDRPAIPIQMAPLQVYLEPKLNNMRSPQKIAADASPVNVSNPVGSPNLNAAGDRSTPSSVALPSAPEQQQQALDMLGFAKQSKGKQEHTGGPQQPPVSSGHAPTSQASTDSREHLLNLIFKANLKGNEPHSSDLVVQPGQDQNNSQPWATGVRAADIPAHSQQVLGSGAQANVAGGLLQTMNPPLSAVYAKESLSNEPSTGRTKKRKETSTTVPGPKGRRKKKGAVEQSHSELASSGDALSSLVNDLAEYLHSKGVSYKVELDDGEDEQDDEPSGNQRGRRGPCTGKAGSFKTTLLKGLEECLQKCVEITKAAETESKAGIEEPIQRTGGNMSLDFLNNVLGGSGATDLLNRGGGQLNPRVAPPPMPTPTLPLSSPYHQPPLQPPNNPVAQVANYLNPPQPQQQPMENNVLAALQCGLDCQNPRPPSYLPTYMPQPHAQQAQFQTQHSMPPVLPPQQPHSHHSQRQSQLATLLQQVAPHARQQVPMQHHQQPHQQQQQQPMMAQNAMPNMAYHDQPPYQMRAPMPHAQQTQQPTDWQRIAQLLMPGSSESRARSMGGYGFDPNARR